MAPTARPPLLRYGVVPLAVAAGMLLRWPLWPVLQGDLAFLLLWPTVIACAWWGGLGPGLLATALSALSAAFFLLEPRWSLAVAGPADLVGVGVFVSVGGALSILSGRMHRGHRLAERRAEEVARQREWLRVSLESIGDAVIATDTEGRVAFLNPTAQALCGWSQAEAQGRPLDGVFRIVDERTGQPAPDPVARVLHEGGVVGLANHTVLRARDGTVRPIEDSAAPIRAGDGRVVGVILVFHDVTDRRRQAAALEERTADLAVAKAHLEAVFHSVGEGITVFDRQGNVVFCNEAEARIAGFASPAEMMRDLGYLAGVFELTDADGRVVPVDRWPATRVLRGEAFADWECHGRRTDTGREWEFSLSGSPVRDAGGRQVLAVVVTRDVTERKRAERALRESEEQFRTSFELAAVGKVQIDPATGRFLRVNRKFCELTGYAPGELAGLTPRDLTHPDDRDADWELVGRMLRGELPVYSNDKRYVRKDGRPVWVNVAATLVRDADGRPARTIGVVQDLTARRAAEEALRESEERFRTLADSIPQLAWTARPDGHIDWYNRRWYEYTGTTPEQMEGWGWQRVHDPEILPKVLDRWQASIDSGEPFDMVFPLRGKDGAFRPFLTRVLPLRGDDGRILQWFGTNTDVSEIKEMEGRLREADRRKDQFVMMLAHELRNPLAPLRNGLAILQAAPSDRGVVDRARAAMARQVGHLTRIIDDLLDVSRLMRGRIELRRERVDLGRLVRTALDDQQPSLGPAAPSVQTDLPELPVWVNADPVRLTQVVDNLVQNAVKFTPAAGTVTVWVRADAGPRQAVLSVRDTGAGIEPGLLPQLFEAFTQADRSLDRTKGGLGLGLSLVKGLVDLHGGQVHAASEGPGRGAEFVVRLPSVPEPAAVTDMPASPTLSPKGLRVLVIEDNRDAADSLKLLLDLFGHDVAVAYTGPAGVEAARGWLPDVVLCDIGLPVLDGYGVARELRQHPATANTRMIAVTGYGSDEDCLKTREAGFDAHLTKPADPSAIQALLAAGTGWEASPAGGRP